MSQVDSWYSRPEPEVPASKKHSYILMSLPCHQQLFQLPFGATCSAMTLRTMRLLQTPHLLNIFNFPGFENFQILVTLNNVRYSTPYS